MKLIVLVLFALSGCGYTSKNNESIAQVVRLHDETPIICPDYKSVQLSLGVVRNGVGSMSHTDLILYVLNDYLAEQLNKAAEKGKLVKIKYNEHRVTFCVPNFEITSVEEID